MESGIVDSNGDPIFSPAEWSFFRPDVQQPHQWTTFRKPFEAPDFLPQNESIESVGLILKGLGAERQSQGKSLILKGISGGADETRTRDLRRDRPAF